ncbi:MAG TPA: peptidase M3, partial [Microbacterium ginsengisoli]|nr:peptidase M3 [Microbacterium ginsengisoli]
MREPLQFPEAADAWLPFVTAFAADRTAVVSDVDWRLVQDASLAPIERLELWNEADIALGELLGAAYLISESHPDAAVREAAESAAQEAEALAAARLLNPDLWAVFAAADAAALHPLEQRLLSHIRRDFRRGGVDLDAETRERVRSLVERDTALSLAFSRNIRDGRREIRVPAEGLAGLP